jgi:hypothetical protein
MSTAQERLEAIQATYDDAKDNEADDLSQASTKEQVATILANVAAARLTFFQAEAATLSANGTAVEATFDAANQANDAVATARQAVEALPTLLGKLTEATSKAAALLKQAKV